MPTRWRSCKYKRPYATLEKAEFAAWHKSTPGVGRLEAYKCQYCPGYHIGHERNGQVGKARTETRV